MADNYTTIPALSLLICIWFCVHMQVCIIYSESGQTLTVSDLFYTIHKHPSFLQCNVQCPLVTSASQPLHQGFQILQITQVFVQQ